MSVPAPFLVRGIEASSRGPSRLWAVKQGARWRICREVCIQVTTASILDREDGPCLSGVGVVTTLTRGRIVITA